MFSENLKNEIIYKYNDMSKLMDIRKNIEKCYKYKGTLYYNIPGAFDIETSNTYINDKKIAFMYIWQFGINGVCFIGRTWEEFIIFYNYVISIFELGENRKLIVYVHNLGFEFGFIRRWFEWDNVFAIKERTPIYASTSDGVIFKCSYLLTNKKLENVAEDLQKYKIKKAVGLLDYKKIRHSKTKLTEKELLYCINDIKVVMAYIQEQIELEKYIYRIPLTKTGYVRRYTRKKCLYTFGNLRNWKYITLMKQLKIQDLKEYQMLRKAFRGGFTHANPFKVNKIIEGTITAFDFCSSYPAVMLAYGYPMSRGKYIKIESMADFYNKLKYYCCVFTIRLSGVKTRNNMFFDSYIQQAQCYTLKGATISNGRVVSCSECVLTITDPDFYIIQKLYTWDKIEFSTFIIYERKYLPKEIIECVLHFYNQKTSLKGVKGEEVNYLLFKEMLNSLYGMTVTDIIRDDIIYNTEWQIQPKTFNEQEEALTTENEKKNRFLFYAWGIFVTAYARRALWSGIFNCGEDYIYSDTDSIYIENADKHTEYISKYNNYITDRINNTLKYYNIDIELARPKTKDGKIKQVGIWEKDKELKRFKTLGAKRYIYEYQDGEKGLTVSGLNKKITLPYLIEKYGENNIFQSFTNKLQIPKGYTGKLTHTYIDDEIQGEITDYKGERGLYFEKSYIHLEDSEYNLTMDNAFIDFLNKISIKNHSL